MPKTVKIIPVRDRVVIRPDEKRKEGRIWLPDSTIAANVPSTGEVLAVGPGRMRNDGSIVEPQVVEGDRVAYNRWAGSPIKIGDNDLLIVRESDIELVL